MNIKIIISLLLICTFCISCEQTKETTPGFTVDIEGYYDPNTLAVVTLKLEGETLPGTPKVVLAENSSSALFEQIGLAEEVRFVGDNYWVALLEIGKSYVIGWISEDNKMFGYISEPFVAQDGFVVPFSPGMPATIEYDLTKLEEDVKIFPTTVLLSRAALNNGRTAIMDFGIDLQIEEPQVVKIEGIAQGSFQLWVQATNASDYLDARERFINDKRIIEIEQGNQNYFEPQFPTYDTTIEDGDVAIKGIVFNSVGEPLADEKIMLVPVEKGNPRLDLYYPESITDSEGNFKFEGISPNIDVVVKSIRGSVSLQKEYLTKDSTLWIDFLIGKLNEKIFVEYSIPDFTVDWKDGTSGRIQALWEKIAVIGVWSTSFPPSKERISKLNELAKEYKDNEDIVFVAMSTDGNRIAWEQAVDSSGFDALRHCKYDFDSKLAFNKPVPYSIIFDKKNIIHAEGIDVDIRAELEKVIEASKEE